MKKEKVTVKYKTSRDICRCCERPLDEPSFSRSREFDFYPKNFLEYSSHWKDFTEKEFVEVITEFVYNTISFFSTEIDDYIHLEPGDMDRVLDFARGKLLQN